MDSDPLRHLEFFSIPNSQTANPVDQPFLAGSSAQQPSIWDSAPLNADAGPAISPSAISTPVSLDSATEPSFLTGLTAMLPNLSSTSRQSRPVLPVRRPRTREGHERKRSRLSINATPLDSIDYWMDFDRDDGLPSIPEGLDLPGQNAKGTGQDAAAGRSTNPPRPDIALKGGEEFVDDSALDNALSDDEDDDDDNDERFSSLNLADHLSKVDRPPPEEVPPREGLYSTPLSWERPQPGLRMDSLIGLGSPVLNEEEQRRLIAIAMNPGPSTGGLGSNINLNFSGLAPGMPMTFGAGLGSGSSPKPVSPPQRSAALPRPAAPYPPKKHGSVSEKGKEKLKPGERTAHNDIERKYRTNLKDKIAELRDAVPALRTVSEEGDEDDGTQPSRTAKVSKGTVLTKATEYIHQLERRNKQIVQQHRELSRRLQAFEQLLNAAAHSSYSMPTYSRTLFDPRGFC